MEYVEGVVLEAKLPAGFADTEAERARIGEALVATLAKLHAVDYRAVGLADFGRPEGYLERQVRRWAQQWERSKTGPLPAIETLARRLAAAMPASPAPTLVHGDYRLGNLALDPRDPGRVAAIFDWEMATLGDPLADLGYTLIYWTEPGEAIDAAGIGSVRRIVTAQPGFATRAELVEAYARATGRDVRADRLLPGARALQAGGDQRGHLRALPDGQDARPRLRAPAARRRPARRARTRAGGPRRATHACGVEG